MVNEEPSRKEESIITTSDSGTRIRLEKVFEELKALTSGMKALSSLVSGFDIKDRVDGFSLNLTDLIKTLSSKLGTVSAQLASLQSLVGSNRVEIINGMLSSGDSLKGDLLRQLSSLQVKVDAVGQEVKNRDVNKAIGVLTQLGEQVAFLETDILKQTQKHNDTIASSIKANMDNLVGSLDSRIAELIETIPPNKDFDGPFDINNFPTDYPDSHGNRLLGELTNNLRELKERFEEYKDRPRSNEVIVKNIPSIPGEIGILPEMSGSLKDLCGRVTGVREAVSSGLARLDSKLLYPDDYPDKKVQDELIQLRSVFVDKFAKLDSSIKFLAEKLEEISKVIPPIDGDGHLQCDVLTLAAIPPGNATIGSVGIVKRNTKCLEARFAKLKIATTYITNPFECLEFSKKTILVSHDSQVSLTVEVATSLDGGTNYYPFRVVECPPGVAIVVTIEDVLPVIRCTFKTSTSLKEFPKTVDIVILGQA